jgi:hypothetical protein
MQIVTALSLLASGNLMIAKAFVAQPPTTTQLLSHHSRRSSASFRMVLEKSPATEKKLQKIEILKIESAHLVHPLKEVGLNGLYAFFIIWKK